MITDLIRFFDRYMPKEGKTPFGYKKETVFYALEIDKNGDLVNIVDVSQGENKGITLVCPSDGKPEASGAVPRFLWGSFKYFFKTAKKWDNKTRQYKDSGDRYFLKNKQFHEELLKGASSEEAIAVLKFFSNDKAVTRDFTDSECDVYNNGRFALRYNGKYLVDNKQMCSLWDNRKLDGDELYSSFSGEWGTARTEVQPQFTMAGTGSGSPLFARKEDVDSYQLKFPMPLISEEDTYKYREALNFMLKTYEIRSVEGTESDKKDGKNKEYRYYKYCTKFGDDLTVLHWAESENDMDFNPFFSGSDTSGTLKSVYDKTRTGSSFRRLSIDVPCHVHGLIGKQGRIQEIFSFVEFWNDIVDNAQAHLDRLKIIGLDYIPSIYNILSLVMADGEKEKQYHNLVKSLVMTVLTGAAYPDYLYSSVIEKAKTAMVTDKFSVTSLTFVRYVSVIKAVMIKNYGREDNLMELDAMKEDVAYLLGRVFAVAWLTVDKDHRNNMDRVKERWFRAAMETPSLAYGQYLQSARLHGANEYKIAEILSKIHVPYPERLSMKEQGMWTLGYYHQVAYQFKIGRTDEDTKEGE